MYFISMLKMYNAWGSDISSNLYKWNLFEVVTWLKWSNVKYSTLIFQDFKYFHVLHFLSLPLFNGVFPLFICTFLCVSYWWYGGAMLSSRNLKMALCGRLVIYFSLLILVFLPVSLFTPSLGDFVTWTKNALSCRKQTPEAFQNNRFPLLWCF